MQLGSETPKTARRSNSDPLAKENARTQSGVKSNCLSFEEVGPLRTFAARSHRAGDHYVIGLALSKPAQSPMAQNMTDIFRY